MNIYTIGFTKKSAENFFSILKENKIRKIVDIRLNNKSQLAGFSKQDDLSYFLKEIADIEYIHMPEYAPSEKILKDYQNKKINWDEYEEKYPRLLDERKIIHNIDYDFFQNACFLCSEPTAEKCHRRLFVEYLLKNNKDINIKHL